MWIRARCGPDEIAKIQRHHLQDQLLSILWGFHVFGDPWNSRTSMLARATYPTRERLKELLHYDPETGIFTRRLARKGPHPAGVRSGGIKPDGYEYIKVDQRTYGAHRLAWLYMTGEVPDYLDHRNGIKSDNVWTNLRLATSSQNGFNQALSSQNTSGVQGVHWSARTQKWCAQIIVNKQHHWLGYHTDIEDAVAAIRIFREQHHGEFANHG